jgi:hypothetical protein
VFATHRPPNFSLKCKDCNTTSFINRWYEFAYFSFFFLFFLPRYQSSSHLKALLSRFVTEIPLMANHQLTNCHIAIRANFLVGNFGTAAKIMAV